MEFKRPLPRSSTPNCHWPPGWDFAGERARPGGRFRRRAVVGMARCAVRRPALSSPRRAGGSKFRRPKAGKRRRGHRRAMSLPKPRSSTPNCHWPPGWDFARERARPGGRFRRRAQTRNPNGIESFSPRLRGRATLGNRPTNFSTPNGLYHFPSKWMKPRWGKNHFTTTTRRSRCASTPG